MQTTVALLEAVRTSNIPLLQDTLQRATTEEIDCVEVASNFEIQSEVD